jgi:hypothetical protein
VRPVLLVLAAALVLIAVLFARSPEPPERDRYRVAEERIEAERARGRLDKVEVERLRLALALVRAGGDGPRTKVLRGEALRSATSEISACRITDLTPWLGEPVGVAYCDFTPAGQ